MQRRGAHFSRRVLRTFFGVKFFDRSVGLRIDRRRVVRTLRWHAGAAVFGIDRKLENAKAGEHGDRADDGPQHRDPSLSREAAPQRPPLPRRPCSNGAGTPSWRRLYELFRDQEGCGSLSARLRATLPL